MDDKLFTNDEKVIDTEEEKMDNNVEVSGITTQPGINVTRIQATSRMSVKIRDNFYTVEYLEERSIPNAVSQEELDKAKAQLFTSVNTTIDAQITEIVEGFKK